MLPQGRGLDPAAVHDTVAALLQDRAYHRSFWASILGRALTAIGNFFEWLADLLRGLPGGERTVLVIMAIIAALIIARIVIAARWRQEGARGGALGRSGRVTRLDPWAEAQALAAAGNHTAAAHALYQAVLRRLAETERLRVHRSKTSGDYVRELRRRGSPLAGPFQAFGRRFDRVMFGVGVCSPAEFDALLRDASAIPDRQVAA